MILTYFTHVLVISHKMNKFVSNYLYGASTQWIT